MAIRIVRLGSPRAANEGMRLGTVRRPPRGVPREDFARLDWYDVWYPVLAPSVADHEARSGRDRPTGNGPHSRASIAPRWRLPRASQSLDVLAALSRHANFSMGCYCENEPRCHRSLLRELLLARGAKLE